MSGCVLVFRDVTAQRHLERERASQLQTARFLSAIIDSSDDAIIRKRLDGTIETWNAGAERLFGYPAADAVGKHISILIPPERIDEEERIIATLKAGRRIDHFETERVRADGVRMWVSLTISPIVDETGTVIAASKIVRDVTAHDGADAVRTAERVRPDVVLMDIGLPVLTGYEACQRIRSHAWGAAMVMVALTGWGQEDDRERALAAGFDLHLVKPINRADLLRIVASAHPRASA